MNFETLHTRPAPEQTLFEGEILPMPVAGNDIGHPPPQVGDAVPAQTPSQLHRTWDKVRDTVTSLPERARQAKATGAQYVAQEPVKATMMAAAGGAALAVLLRAAIRRGRR